MNNHASNLAKYIQKDSAIEILEDREIDDPSESVEDYVRSIPDLLKWFDSNGREYSWRKTENEWEILVAEILLQRTRADSVSEVYTEFIETFPDPKSLHQAEDEEIKNVIRGLGLVNHRTRSLNEVSELIAEDYNGKIPDNVEKLKQCWRIGEYVTRAVKIFSRGKPVALVDANIARIMERIFGLELSEQPHKDQEFYKLMENLTPKEPKIARKYYLALIDLGALVCTPKNPEHEKCPFKNCCKYYNG